MSQLRAAARSSARPKGDTAPEPASAFPLRVAAIDVGSNAIRFVAAEFTGPTAREVLDEERMAVRLGHDVFLTGKLAPEAMDAAVAGLADVRGRMEALGVEHYRATATSAVRESRNGAAFARRVREEAELELEVITGWEEARLVHQAIRSRVELGRDRWITVDLGGGSVEVSLVDDAGILWSESHTMGSVRLLEVLSGSGDDPGRFQRLLREYAATLQIPAAAQHLRPAGVIATGGNIEALAKLAGVPPRGGRTGSLRMDALRDAIAMLARLSYRQRVEELKLRPDRADVILPAAMVYERVAELAGVDEIRVPGVGVRDGLLLDLVEDLTTHQEWEDRRERTAVEGAVALGRRYLFDEAHALHVARLAGSLFDQLRDVHGLAAADRRILLAAAVLHDVGAYISRKRHHKHSLYLVSQSELPGLAPGEIWMVANVARYHRKGEPTPDHDSFARLDAGERERVTRMAALLRIADALDREHLQAVEEVRARARKKELLLEAQSSGDLLLERWALRQKAGLFTRTFGLEVRLAGDDGDG
ncbi:MAG TPA: Ppx/GppA phosphatase family protein [Longimicrobiaceae bacterium]|nr:Ppx/GppA phosphatase family protein [Longimicrobiaceae bacterium]